MYKKVKTSALISVKRMLSQSPFKLLVTFDLNNLVSLSMTVRFTQGHNGLKKPKLRMV